MITKATMQRARESQVLDMVRSHFSRTGRAFVGGNGHDGSMQDALERLELKNLVSYNRRARGYFPLVSQQVRS